MTFNEDGSKHPYGLYTTAIDLRSNYGTHMHSIHIQMLGVENQPDKHNEGEYIIYYNLSPALPVNTAMALIMGVNPKRPGWRPIWRGDVVIVKTQEWPLPIGMGEGAHMDYVDVRLSVMSLFNSCIRRWYHSEGWANTLNTEQEMREYFALIFTAYLTKAIPLKWTASITISGWMIYSASEGRRKMT